MKLLHTSDWHVGKSIRGNSRAKEHEQVLDEITKAAVDHDVDLVLVAGDVFETAAPTADSERIVYKALLQLAEVAPVVVISGNHDNHRRLQAVAPLFDLGRVTMATQPAAPDKGGVIDFNTREGESVRVALLPFVSQRAIVNADALMSDAAFKNAQSYAERTKRIVDALSASFSADSVNIILAHAFVKGGVFGGGERSSHLVEEYAINSLAFPSSATYVALGHLHRPQVVQGPTSIHYCGSPLQLDFGEEEQAKQVNIVQAEPGLPAKVKPVVLESGKKLVTLSGSLEQLKAQKEQVEDAWLRVQVDEPFRVGLADEVKDLLGDGVVEVRVDQRRVSNATTRRKRDGRSPKELFSDYLEEQETQDDALIQAFAELYEESQEQQLVLDAVEVARTEALQ